MQTDQEAYLSAIDKAGNGVPLHLSAMAGYDDALGDRVNALP